MTQFHQPKRFGLVSIIDYEKVVEKASPPLTTLTERIFLKDKTMLPSASGKHQPH